MNQFKKIAACLLTLSLVFSMLLAGCGGQATNTEQGNTEQENTKETSATPTTEPKIQITMFMNNSGLGHPEGVDPSDNPWINIVEKAANVDLVIDVPGYNDYPTKLTLLLASGDLPDIVHSTNPTETFTHADEGAFIDLKSYYDHSAIIKKYVSEEKMEVGKSPSGKYYRIPMPYDQVSQGQAVSTRWDLVSKYNNNKFPESVDEWIATFRAMHKAEPDSIVMTNRAINDKVLGYGGLPIYFWYGALPYDYRFDTKTGKAVPNFTLPEFKAATIVMKQLYDEGILDKEFATTDTVKYTEKGATKNIMLTYNSMDQTQPYGLVNRRLGIPDPRTKTWESRIAPPLKKYPAEVDPKYAETCFKSTGIANSGMYISSKSPNKDRAWRVIEGFASDELYELIFWGKEGSEYTVVNGQRVPNVEKLADKSRSWSLHLAVIFGFVNGQDVKKATAEAGLGKEYSDAVYKSIEPWDAKARENGVSPSLLADPFLSTDAKNKLVEKNNFISAAAVEAIMGKITMDQFDQRVKDFQQKYGFIYDELAKILADKKADFTKQGLNYNF